ncbi:MAG: hypothetical protein KF752_08250 [Pirellulaceae bacterium]|nr:hypothetical protein [Pirellulaceae bacterium]
MSKIETQAIVNAEVDLVETVKKANSGDKQSLAILRRELVGEHANAIIDFVGNLANSLEQSTLNAMLGDGQQGTRLVLLRRLEQMRTELGWNESPKLERILIERVCQTWLYLHWLEMVDAQSMNRSIDRVKYESERVERAECRHLRAVKMLATVRKMALPLRIDLKAELTVAESKSPAIGPRSQLDLVNSTNQDMA